MQAVELRHMYEFGYRATKLNLEGITHEESVREIPGGANCANWVLGHIIAARGTVLRTLGSEPMWDAETARPYSGQEDAEFKAENALPLERLLADFDASQERVLAALSAATPELLATPFKDRTVADRVAFFHFHEGYHAGQIGLIRRLLGKAGVIKAPKSS